MNRQFFDLLYARSDDPWHLRASWYEQRKRAVLLASLPAARFAQAYEPGCATGLLTSDLAGRCDHLLASDGSARAVQQTRELVAEHPHVRVVQAWLPEEWPAGEFDLVVLSEFLYYLPLDALDRLLDCVVRTTSAGAAVVACHWRAPIEGCALAGDALHQRLQARLAMPQLAHYRDADFCLDVWQASAQSPAEIESRR